MGSDQTDGLGVKPVKANYGMVFLCEGGLVLCLGSPKADIQRVPHDPHIPALTRLFTSSWFNQNTKRGGKKQDRHLNGDC